MLKKRIIAVVMIQNNLVVQSIGFSKILPIGKIETVLEFLEYWDIDEIVILDISATLENRIFNEKLISNISKSIFIPISIGGGIKNIQDIQRIIQYGADKVIVNSTLFHNTKIITECKNTFGSQSIIACIDIKKDLSNNYIIYSHSGTKIVNIKIDTYLKKLESLGIGEIIINSIDNDGKKTGYDIDLINYVKNLVNIPIIAMGGASTPNDFIDIFEKTNINAAAAGNMFHYTEHSTAICKGYLESKEINIRTNKELDYSKYIFDNQCRIMGTEQ